MTTTEALTTVLQRFPRFALAHTPTPIEKLSNLGADLGISLHVKRDDYTGVSFGGNKVRQLEFYFGAALEQGADTVLVTGAIQSNFARCTAAIARKLNMECHIQLEERVPDVSDLHRTSGNALLDRLLGVTIHKFPEGEDELAADASLKSIADALATQGRRPYIIPLGSDSPPLGALGYVDAAVELVRQTEVSGGFDEIVLASGSALTHVGLLLGLRYLGINTPVTGICVRRDAGAQSERVLQRIGVLAEMMGVDVAIDSEDVVLYDGTFAPGYGLLNAETTDAIRRSARSDGLFLDPTYTGKAMAGLIHLSQAGRLSGDRVLFWHTGGQPALFAYGDQLLESDESSVPSTPRLGAPHVT